MALWNVPELPVPAVAFGPAQTSEPEQAQSETATPRQLTGFPPAGKASVKAEPPEVLEIVTMFDANPPSIMYCVGKVPVIVCVVPAVNWMVWATEPSLSRMVVKVDDPLIVVVLAPAPVLRRIP
jgi:hypothetical protein